MGHSVEAIICPQAVEERLRLRSADVTAVTVGWGLALIPWTDVLFDGLGEGAAEFEGPPWKILQRHVEIFKVDATGSGLVYLETDYFGGRGTQCAVIFDGSGGVRIESGAGAINRALLDLRPDGFDGVEPFLAVGLGSIRHTEAWLEP